eukprot:Selendium_serpulae@DN4577_c0_g1_i2.p1
MCSWTFSFANERTTGAVHEFLEPGLTEEYESFKETDESTLDAFQPRWDASLRPFSASEDIFDSSSEDEITEEIVDQWHQLLLEPFVGEATVTFASQFPVNEKHKADVAIKVGTANERRRPLAFLVVKTDEFSGGRPEAKCATYVVNYNRRCLKKGMPKQNRKWAVLVLKRFLDRFDLEFWLLSPISSKLVLHKFRNAKGDERSRLFAFAVKKSCEWDSAAVQGSVPQSEPHILHLTGGGTVKVECPWLKVWKADEGTTENGVVYK